MLKNGLRYLSAFLLSKSSVFIGPLLLSGYMSTKGYGKMEYALGGLGFILNTILGFGIPGSYAYFLLNKKDVVVRDGYSLYLLLLIAYFIIIQIFFFIFPSHIYLALIISYILANQVFYSYVFKSEGKSINATLTDGGIYFIIILVIAYCEIFGVKLEVENFIVPMVIYGLVYFFIGIYKNLKLNLSNAWLQFKKIIPYSSQLLINSFIIILLINSGRFVLEFLSTDFEDIAIFGFYLRVSGISLVVFQMLFILYFKKIYTLEFKILDRVFAVFLIILLLYSVISLFILPSFISSFSTFFRDSFHDQWMTFFTLTFFTFYWTVYNIFSNIMVREGLVKQFNYISIFILIFFLLTLKLVEEIDVVLFSKIQLIISILIVVSQQILLIVRGYYFRKSILIIVVAILCTCFLVLSNSDKL